MDLSTSLHQCRTANLRRLDASGKVMVSIGAADLWYFKWIQESCGTPSRHIGVEYYMPKPDGLPEGTEWVSNTAGSMPDVPSNIADILFSGQNIEHLWKEEIEGFLTEAHRILKVDGLMVLDSPNRLVTQAYGGAHPEHMVELTPAEAEELVTAAGFDVISNTGIFLCKEPRTGTLLSIADLAGPFSVIERSILGDSRPDDSYIWWIQARRSERAPDVERIREIIQRYWAIGWPERLNRLVSNTGVPGISESGSPTWDDAEGVGGALAYGPYAPLKAGAYKAAIWVRQLTEASPQTSVGSLDVVCGDGSIILAQKTLLADDLGADWTRCELEFELDRMQFGFQIRLFSTGEAGLSVKRQVELLGDNA